MRQRPVPGSEQKQQGNSIQNYNVLNKYSKLIELP